MRIKEKTNKKKLSAIIVIIIILILVAGGVAAYFYYNNISIQIQDRPENTPDYNPPTNEQKSTGDRAKQDFIERQDENESNSQQGNPPTQEASVTFSSASQNGTIYQLRTMIETIDGDGACTLRLTKEGSTPITHEAGTQILGGYSVCKGFDIPTGTMQKGTWKAVVSYKGSSGQFGTAERMVEVK